MGWRDRAEFVAAPAPPASSWRARAEFVAPAEPRAPTPHVPDAGETFVQGVSNAVGGVGDFAGAVLQAGLSEASNIPDLLAGEKSIADVQAERNRVFADARQDNASRRELGMAAHPVAGIAGRVAPNVLLAPVTGGRSLAGAVSGNAALGALEGGLTSKGDTAGDVLSDVATGAGLAGAAGGIGYGAGKVLRWAGDKIVGRATDGRDAARELAEAMATRDVKQTVGSIRGEAGGAASRVGNTISNIDEIAVDPNAARTAGYMRERLGRELVELEEDIADAEAKAIASGLDPEDLGVGRIGEFISKGSKLDKAQRAAKKIATYRTATDEIRGQLEDLDGVADDFVLPSNAQDLISRQAALRGSPYFADVKENVLKNSLNSFERDASDAMAKRAAFQAALAGEGEAIEKGTDELLSGRAAAVRAGQLGLRYGLPVAGSYIGGEVGGPEGAVIGAGAGWASGAGAAGAVGALAGAGLRPGAQALLRTATSFPAAKNALWSGVGAVGEAVEGAGDALPGAARAASAAVVEARKGQSETDMLRNLAKTNPRALGEFLGPISSAIGRSTNGDDKALAVTIHVLNQTNEKFREMMARQNEGKR